MLRYKLRTLLIVLAILPPMIWGGWTKYQTWQVKQEQLRARRVWLDRYLSGPSIREVKLHNVP